MFGFTIDTIRLYLSPENYSIFQFEYLKDNFCNSVYSKGGIEWYSGNDKNFKFEISRDNGINLIGSLSNYYCGKNEIMPIETIPQAIESLENSLKLDLNEARVFRCDIALNVKPNLKGSKYSHFLLTDLPKFKRLVQDDGLRFENKSLVFAFYNKSKELLEKNGIQTEHDVLRFEFRIRRNVSKYLKIDKFSLLDLKNTQSIIVILELFEKYYSKIKFQMMSNENREPSILTPSMFNDLLVSKYINEKGSAHAYDLIEQLVAEGRIKTSVNKSRCREIVKDTTRNFDFTIHPLAEELSHLIHLSIEEAKHNLNTKIKTENEIK